jgi:hypothetical protein
MEIKVTVTIEAGQSLANLISMLQPLEVYAPSKETLEAIEEMDKIQEKVKESKKVEKPKVEAPKENERVDFELIRTQIKKLGAEKRAAGKEISPIFKRYGAGKLSQIDNENLSAVLEEIKGL